MAFRFKLGEPFDEGARRILAEQIERAEGLLKDDGDQVVAVHETRKTLKRLRALLRLIRPAIGETAFKEENARLRDIGLSLSGARDRHVLLETVSKLEASIGFGRRGLADTLRQRITAVNGVGAPMTLEEARARLDDAKERLAGLDIAGKGFEVVGPGLEWSYRRARRAFANAYDRPSDEAFHEWRKGAQAHWRQMTLLARAWPEYLAARALEARTLSQALGDDHDLALLAAFVHSDAAGIGAEQAALVEKVVRKQQEVLRERARPRGERLFAEGPKRLKRSIGVYWDAAAAMKEPEFDQGPASGRIKRARQQGKTTARRGSIAGKV